MLPILLPQEVLDGMVVLAMFFVRIGLPLGIIMTLGYWLQRRVRPEDFPEVPAAVAKTSFRKRLAREINALPAWLPTVALLIVTGVFAGLYRFGVGLGIATNLNQGYPWGLWIGFDLFMVAFSGGAFTLATIVYVFNLHEYHAAIRPTVLTGLLGYSSVLLILMVDLGRWDRFYHFIIYPNINSALFEVSWCILLYTTVLVAEFTPVVLERTHWDRAKNLVRKLPIPLAIIGATLSSLHQSSLGTLFVIMSERVNALWYTTLMPLLFFISSVAAGLALVIAGGTVSYWVFKRSLPQRLIGGLARLVPPILVLYGLIRVGDLVYRGDLVLLMHQNIYSVLYITEFMLLVIVPIVLFSMKGVRESRGLSFFAATILLIGVFMNRFDVAWWTVSPVAGYSYFPSITEIMVQAGVLSACVFVYTLVGHYFPLFEGLAPTVEQRRAEADAAAYETVRA